MPSSSNLIAQSAPAAASQVNIYEVGSTGKASVETLIVCNRGVGGDSFRFSIAPLGISDSIEQYIYYDATIDGKSTVLIDFEKSLRLSAYGVIRVYSASGQLSFTISGTEESA